MKTNMVKYKERMRQYIDNIAQLSTDARYEQDPEKLMTELKSIEYWSVMAQSLTYKTAQERLQEIKTILQHNKDLYYIQTTNKETGWIGCASFHTNEDKIFVYEGDGSGKDDTMYTYDEFVKKYEFDLMKEE